MMNIRTGIDLGGTKIEIMVLNSNDQPVFQKRVATPQGDYKGTLSTIKNLVIEAETELGQKSSVGIGTPGAISQKTGQLKNANSVCLNQQAILQDLENLLDRPIRISNDANCFALSEALDGAAKNANCVFGVIIGTGTGAGIVINQQLLQGANHVAGEWGHNPLPWIKKSEHAITQCYCGKQNCIETFLSGPGLQADYLKETGEKLSSEEIVKGTIHGNSECESCLQRYEDRLARALAHVINIIDPDIIVLGGGMSNIQRLYVNVPRRWSDYVFSDQVITKLIPAKFGDASGVRGAARLWPK